MRLLIIEPDALTRESVDLMLRSEGCTTHAAEDGEEGIEIASLYDFDAIVMSLDLQDISGLSALRRLRARVKTPVIALSKESGFQPEIDALTAGADDFIRKPFHKDVLNGRLNALVRRAGGHAEPVIRLGRVAINTIGRSATVDGARLHLTGKEYQVLASMALRIGHTFTKEALLDCLYGGRDEPEPKIIDVFVCKIRNKLKAFDAAKYVETVWGRGYRVVAEPTPHQSYEPRGTMLPYGYAADILKRLGDGPATFPELWALFPVAPESSIRGALYTLVNRGDVINEGEPRSARYRLREPRQAAA